PRPGPTLAGRPPAVGLSAGGFAPVARGTARPPGRGAAPDRAAGRLGRCLVRPRSTCPCVRRHGPQSLDLPALPHPGPAPDGTVRLRPPQPGRFPGKPWGGPTACGTAVRGPGARGPAGRRGRLGLARRGHASPLAEPLRPGAGRVRTVDRSVRDL